MSYEILVLLPIYVETRKSRKIAHFISSDLFLTIFRFFKLEIQAASRSNLRVMAATSV